MENTCSLKGNKENVTNTINNPHAGAKKYWYMFDILGKTNSFENNLIASLNGWAKPIILTLLGPLRNWL